MPNANSPVQSRSVLLLIMGLVVVWLDKKARERVFRCLYRSSGGSHRAG